MLKEFRKSKELKKWMKIKKRIQKLENDLLDCAIIEERKANPGDDLESLEATIPHILEVKELISICIADTISNIANFIRTPCTYVYSKGWRESDVSWHRFLYISIPISSATELADFLGKNGINPELIEEIIDVVDSEHEDTVSRDKDILDKFKELVYRDMPTVKNEKGQIIGWKFLWK